MGATVRDLAIIGIAAFYLHGMFAAGRETIALSLHTQRNCGITKSGLTAETISALKSHAFSTVLRRRRTVAQRTSYSISGTGIMARGKDGR